MSTQQNHTYWVNVNFLLLCSLLHVTSQSSHYERVISSNMFIGNNRPIRKIFVRKNKTISSFKVKLQTQ